jgi:hypothetical protein
MLLFRSHAFVPIAFVGSLHWSHAGADKPKHVAIGSREWHHLKMFAPHCCTWRASSSPPDSQHVVIASLPSALC